MTTLSKGGLGVLHLITLKTYIVRFLSSKRVGGGVGIIRFSHHTCTDLKNGPDEFQKALKTGKT